MNTKIISSLAALAAVSLASAALAEGSYRLDQQLSSVSFATTKKQYVIEPATIANVSGSLKADGSFTVVVPWSGLDTVNPIRDQRLRELFFDAAKFPGLSINGKLDPATLPKAGQVQAMSVSAELMIWKTSKPLALDVLVANTGKQLMVSSTKPLIIKAEDFGIPAANLAKLAGTVGDIQLAAQAPVNFNLVLSPEPK